eukprot:11241517-Karenia_brevis.AAC.1
MQPNRPKIKKLEGFVSLAPKTTKITVTLDDPEILPATMNKVRDMVGPTMIVSKAVPPMLIALDAISRSAYQLLSAATKEVHGMAVPAVTTTAFNHAISPDWSMSLNDPTNKKKHQEDQPVSVFLSASTEWSSGIPTHKVQVAATLILTSNRRLKSK